MYLYSCRMWQIFGILCPGGLWMFNHLASFNIRVDGFPDKEIKKSGENAGKLHWHWRSAMILMNSSKDLKDKMACLATAKEERPHSIMKAVTQVAVSSKTGALRTRLQFHRMFTTVSFQASSENYYFILRTLLRPTIPFSPSCLWGDADHLPSRATADLSILLLNYNNIYIRSKITFHHFIRPTQIMTLFLMHNITTSCNLK